MKKKNRNKLVYCTFGDGDGYVTSVWLWREK